MHDDEWDGAGGGSRRAHGFLAWTAFRAYNELLRVKFGCRFEAQDGPWMDRLAELLVQLVNARWEGGRKGDAAERDVLAQIDRHLNES